MTAPSSIRMVDEPIPRRAVKIAATFEFDSNQPFIVDLNFDATIVEVHYQPGDRVSAGAVLVEISAAALEHYQTQYLWYRDIGYRGTGDPLLFDAAYAETFLRHLGFSNDDLYRLRRHRQLRTRWPIRTRQAGIVTSIAGVGLIVSGAPIANIAWMRTICFQVPAADAPLLGAPAGFGPTGRDFRARVSGVQRNDSVADVRLHVTNTAADIHLGNEVRVQFWAEEKQRRSFRLPSGKLVDGSDWGHSTLPRGQELRRFAIRHGIDPADVGLKPAISVCPSELPNRAQIPDEELRPGTPGRMSIVINAAQRKRHELESFAIERAHIPSAGDLQGHHPTAIISIPADCVAPVGKVHEVLLDRGPLLTPRPVKLGTAREGRIEIESGLSEGERVIRNLPQLARRHQRINAVLVGLWHDGLGWWEGGLDK